MTETNCMAAGFAAPTLKISPLGSRWHVGKGETDREYFRTNLEHLEMIETIMKLRLCEACLRIKGLERLEKTPFARLARKYPDLKSVREGIQFLEGKRKLMEKSSLKEGIELKLLRLAETYGLNEFDQLIVQLLLVYQTSVEFKALVEACNDETWGSVFPMPSTGAILSILCPDYKSQLNHLPHFSMEGTLIGESIIKAEGFIRKKPVMDVNMSLDGQIVRFLMGDERRYRSDFSCIEVTRPSAGLEQVIIDEKLKKDIVEYAENFVRSKNCSPCNDNFFGYGTGLTMLFHGPSGTGKTMMAHALADHLGKKLLSPISDDIDELFDISDILPRLFREARLSDGIVFLDECDDIIRADSAANRAFLIEIEKAGCITILATNKVSDLDPALERRINLRVRFRLPDRDERARIWQTLLPPNVKMADDVTFEELAERFVFTGGLIKNAIVMALNSAEKKGTNIILSRKALFKAASYQAQTMFDTSSPEHSYKPDISIQSLPIRAAEKAFLARLPEAQRRSLEKRECGILCYLGCRDQETAVSCVEAVAAECDAGVSMFKLSEILAPPSREQMVLDRITQKEIDPLDYVFSSRTGRNSVVAIIDEQLVLKNYLRGNNSENAHRWQIFLKRAVKFPGLLFIIGEPLKEPLPFEFTCNLAIQTPPEELQIETWQKHLPRETEDAIVSLVEQYPLHLKEIAEIANQAMITAMLKDNRQDLEVKDILPVIKRFLGIRQTPVLFGKLDLDI